MIRAANSMRQALGSLPTAHFTSICRQHLPLPTSQRLGGIDSQLQKAAPMRSLTIIASILIATTTLAAQRQVENSVSGPLRTGSSVVYTGMVNLPAEGLWQTQNLGNAESVRELYLVPSSTWRARQLGKRVYAVLEKDAIAAGGWHIREGYYNCKQFAVEGTGRGPSTMKELAAFEKSKESRPSWTQVSQRAQKLIDFFDKAPTGRVIHLIPDVKFELVKEPLRPHEIGRAKNGYRPPVRWRVPKEKRQLLAFEIRPLVDDGKHWILYTDGSSERVLIDNALLEKTGQKISPLISKQERKTANERRTIPYKVIALTDQQSAAKLNIEIHNHVLNESQKIGWSLNTAKQDLQGPHAALMEARLTRWVPYMRQGAANILRNWSNGSNIGPINNRRGRTTSAFSILGGRAAVEETLQLQVLDTTQVLSEELPAGNKPVDINSVAGVQVQSHPFKKMLAGKTGGHLELANYAPHDRFFVYVGKPTTLDRMLDAGAPFIASVGSALTGNALNYGLESRYLKRLGMNRAQLDAILKSGLVREMALFCPDLFFIDGTDLTVIAKVEQRGLLNGLFQLLNPQGELSDGIMEMPGKDKPAFVALRGNLLFLSTNRSELETSLKLQATDGKHSLGESDEFRYMLTKLGITDKTRCYAYFSDPFVRRLVGPEVKIGQLRRVLAKRQMEALTARGMLARIDDPQSDLELEHLTTNGYLPEDWESQDYHFDQSGIVHSKVYGTLDNMQTLIDTPVKTITAQEAKAYAEYLRNYSNYWRRFFDPIAIRLDEAAPQQLEVSTFILPLVDNTIYNALRMALETDRTASTLDIPDITPTPIVKLSLNLSEMTWQTIAETFSELFTRYTGTNAAVLDDLGPSMHLAIFDSDPIIALGSGDVFGAFGSSMSGMDTDMAMIPIALSMFTRPCSIFIETRNPERTAQLLRQAATAFGTEQNRVDEFSAQIFQVGDEQKWVWMLDIMGMLKLRYGIEIVDDYIVVRNIPWSTKEKIIQVESSELNAASLLVNPGSCVEQMPGLFAAASDANSRVAMSGLARLMPFMIGKNIRVEEAMKEHQRLFGFFPKTVLGDRLEWKHQHLVSTDYGEPLRQRQPVFDPQKPFGLMNQIDFLRLEMQFENDGLRSSIRWRLRQPNN